MQSVWSRTPLSHHVCIYILSNYWIDDLPVSLELIGKEKSFLYYAFYWHILKLKVKLRYRGAHYTWNRNSNEKSWRALNYLEEGHAILEKWLRGTLYLKIDFDSKESYIVYYMVTQIFCFGCYSSWQRWRRLLLSCRMSPKGYTPCVLYAKGMSHKLFVSWNVTFFIAGVWSLWMNSGELLLHLMDLRLPGAAANICYHSKRNHCSHSPHLSPDTKPLESLRRF